MNKSTMWGFEVSHIVTAFAALAGSNILLNILGMPIIFSWFIGIGALLSLRVVSHGQKNGHLELLGKYVFESHIYLGHKSRYKEIQEAS